MKDERVTLRISPDVKQRWVATAAADGITLSEWARVNLEAVVAGKGDPATVPSCACGAALAEALAPLAEALAPLEGLPEAVGGLTEATRMLAARQGGTLPASAVTPRPESATTAPELGFANSSADPEHVPNLVVDQDQSREHVPDLVDEESFRLHATGSEHRTDADGEEQYSADVPGTIDEEEGFRQAAEQAERVAAPYLTDEMQD